MAANTSSPSAQRIRQKRSQKTYDALIETSFKLLEKREFDDISIAELSKKAGYSVGAFYARFKSKDELFDAMLEQHIEDRRAARARQFATESDETLVRALLEETVSYFWSRRRFWRAALIRSIWDPDFWQPLRALSHELSDSLILRITSRSGCALTQDQETNVRFAVQLTLGTVNNTIINRPGPIFMDQALFVDNLTRAFLLVSGYNELLAAKLGSQPRGKRA